MHLNRLWWLLTTRPFLGNFLAERKKTRDSPNTKPITDNLQNRLRSKIVTDSLGLGSDAKLRGREWSFRYIDSWLIHWLTDPIRCITLNNSKIFHSLFWSRAGCSVVLCGKLLCHNRTQSWSAAETSGCVVARCIKCKTRPFYSKLLTA